MGGWLWPAAVSWARAAAAIGLAVARAASVRERGGVVAAREEGKM